MSQRTKKSDVAIIRAAAPILDVVIHSCSDSILKRIFHALQDFRLNRGEEVFKWNLRTSEIEAMHPNCFVRKVKVLSGNEVARKAADVSEALRLIEVGALPTQFLSKQFLLGYIHTGTEKAFENSLFDNPHTHAANVPHLAVRTN